MTSFKKELSPIALAEYVDKLAMIKAAIADLQAEEAGLKADLIATGNTVIEGSLHRCAISHCEGREIIDWRAIAVRLEPSRQLISAHTSVGAPYDVVKLYAKKTS